VILACIWVGSMGARNVFAEPGTQAITNHSKFRITQKDESAARRHTFVPVHR
jgi:hypothetical protein